MLCFVVMKWSRAMQLKLAFPETLQPHALLWTTLDEETRHAVMECLGELIARAALANPDREGKDND